MPMNFGDSSKINRLENSERLSYIQRRKELEEIEAMKQLLTKRNQQIQRLKIHFDKRNSLTKDKFYNLLDGGQHEIWR